MSRGAGRRRRSRGAPRRSRPPSALNALAVAALSVMVLSACSSAPDLPPETSPGPSTTGSSVDVPLATSLATRGSSWAIVAMGHLDDPVNTFWQLLTLPSGSSRWELATPPGVASNGGLVASIMPPATVTAGFEPSVDLLFSPLAQRLDPATTWSSGVLPGAMAASPDALATSADHRYLALLRDGGGRVVASSGALSTWSTVISKGGLAADRAASGCGITSLTAVAFGDGGADLVGTACARGSRAGIFEQVDGSWQAVGPVLPGGSSGPNLVLRMLATPAGVTALVGAGTGASRTLYALFSADGLRTWTVSAPLRLDRARLASTGVTAVGGLIVTTIGDGGGGGDGGDGGGGGGGGGGSASVVGPSGGRWQALTAPPVGTSVVVAGPGGTFEALIADQSTLDVDVLEAGGWRRVQSLSVPIQYGSSS